MVMKTIKKLFKIWLDNMNEFYRPMIENNVPIWL